jgi:hypothetical protein
VDLEWISTVIKLSFKPLICREIPIKLGAEMDQADAACGRAFGGRGISKLSLGGADPLPYTSMLPGERTRKTWTNERVEPMTR